MVLGIKTIGVIGTGVIGSSWTALFLAKGLRVLVSDPAPGAKDKLAAYIKKEWPILERMGLTPGASQTNYEFVDDVANHLDRVDFVQENAPEQVAFKSKLFALIDQKAHRDMIIASSSSGIPSSQFIKDCKVNPGRILIGHPFNPPHLIPLVEVVPHAQTSSTSISTAIEFYRSLGKSPILVKKETPGFIANRLQAAIIAEAFSLVANGVASPQDVDAAITTGLGVRWALSGPYMTAVAGGGGGIDGFSNMMKKLGPAVEGWLGDMERHKFEFSDENVGALNESLKQWLEKEDLVALSERREEVLLELLRLKKEHNV
ncbi:hypothetical protein G7Y89_g12618 [Cudoniella acicularis]|uniref:3-hydroxyacyl-CoA dehyrogenase n=1 Tax=Cudoniella acicularis TaxID=354080 RepID=A0A8H4R8G2_9HELO|nr:hypothetical protein G7Y89_g12618 [Cudoniella acicularis]